VLPRVDGHQDGGRERCNRAGHPQRDYHHRRQYLHPEALAESHVLRQQEAARHDKRSADQQTSRADPGRKGSDGRRADGDDQWERQQGSPGLRCGITGWQGSLEVSSRASISQISLRVSGGSRAIAPDRTSRTCNFHVKGRFTVSLSAIFLRLQSQGYYLAQSQLISIGERQQLLRFVTSETGSRSRGSTLGLERKGPAG
jgi:hypothetical protein